MDQSQAPLLDALVEYHAHRCGFTPPGHRLGRCVDDRVLDVLGHEPFRDDSHKSIVARLIFSGVQPRWMPGVPAVVLGKRLTDCVVEYVRTGGAAGVNVPDAADTSPSRFALSRNDFGPLRQ